jgi:uridylate kinase
MSMRKREPYKRILLKLSGEALMGPEKYGIDPPTVARIAGDVATAHHSGYEVCLVVGGGNIFRGLSAAAKGYDRASADYIGMLATVMNAIALQNALESMDVPTRVLSAMPIAAVCEPYIRRRALRHLEKGRVVIFAAGTGNPFFTTDTAAALRASEMGCNVILKGTQVDGVYSDDPKICPDAERYDTLTYMDLLSRDLKVMDAAAIALARENNIPILVFSLHTEGGLTDVLRGEGRATLIHNGGSDLS